MHNSSTLIIEPCDRCEIPEQVSKNSVGISTETTVNFLYLGQISEDISVVHNIMFICTADIKVSSSKHFMENRNIFILT